MKKKIQNTFTFKTLVFKSDFEGQTLPNLYNILIFSMVCSNFKFKRVELKFY